MGEIQTYASNSGDFNFLFVLIIVGTYLLYEVGKAIVDNNDDDDYNDDDDDDDDDGDDSDDNDDDDGHDDNDNSPVLWPQAC